MSEEVSSEPSEGEPEIDVFEYLIEYDSEIVENEELIRDALDTTVNDGTNRRQITSLMTPLSRAISLGIGPEEAENITYSLLRIVMDFPRDIRESLSEEGASEELIDLITSLIVSYSEDLERAQFRISQGPRYWSYFDSQFLVDDDNIALQHELTIDREETVQFHSSVTSDWGLVEHIVNTQKDYLENTGPESFATEVDEFSLGRTIGILNLLRKVVESEGVEVEVPELTYSKDE